MKAIAEAASANADSDTFTAPNGMELSRSKLYVDDMGRVIAKIGIGGVQLDRDATDHIIAYYFEHNLMYAENAPGINSLATYDQAEAVAKSLIEANHGGFNDWALPSPDQGIVMVDYTREDPAVDLSVHPGTASGGYWTNQQTRWTKGNAGSARSFFVVGMGSGDVSGDGAYARFRVRPVRRARPAGQ